MENREWNSDKLGSVIEIKYGKDHKKLSEGNFPCLGSGGIMRYVDSYLYDDESILIPRKGSLNNIMFQNSPFWTVDTMFWSKIDKSKVFPKYLFYQLTLIDYENLNVGSAVPSLTVPVINEIEIQLPPLPEQKAIASVLSSLDDKIDLLHQQNQTLEALAETLFRQWFIEEAKEDWEEVSLGSIIDLVVDNRGKTPPTVDYRTEYPLIEVNAINTSDCLVNYNVIRKYVVEETYNTWFRKHLKVNDVIVSTVGTIGVFSIFTSNIGCIAQNLIGLRSNNISPYYIYLFLKINKEDILNLDIGGVQPSIKVPHLMDLKFKKPNIEMINEFHEIVKEYFDKIGTNQQQIQTLTQLRDTLLPKLMSGEVRVKN
ncbi:restriction endonuclease subunit S [Empedobacter sp. 189-2]|uniref:restriction endonuclease subunit S n=1 Tax=Empedobacter sp. 189-2 TaxID=2746724 RepID=UPI002576F451|nr:restriction endonuclease subunit S [Empedobacter sp. 189-2]MDM1543906.1 restriction endonuclease subunit S [Empedobacter sp. 189-2]